MTRSLLAIMALASAVGANAQLVVNTTLTPQQLVENVLVGSGVTVSNVKFNGMVVSTPQDGSGSFTNGAATNLGLDAGVILSSGLAANLAGPASYFGSDQLGTGSDPDLLAITTPGNTIQDKSILEFDFIPDGDSLRFNFVFGSEEYPSFNCSPTYNDVFGFFLSGPGITGPYTNQAINIALVPGTTLPVGIQNIHGTGGSCGPANAQYYVDNANGTSISLNGFTTVLRAEAAVTCGVTYHIKLAIGDAGDGSYNSAVFLQAGSFQSNVLPTLSASSLVDGTTAEGCGGTSFIIHRPANTDSTLAVHFYFTGTATPGVDYAIPPSPVYIQAGQNSVSVPFLAIDDGITEGIETAIMNVFMVNNCGDTITNSTVLVIVDYPPIEFHTTSPMILACDQDSVPVYASISGGFGLTEMLWGDTLASDHIYVPGKENGTYTIYAHDQCPKTASTTIVVDAGCQVVIPNVITPNGDGHNDHFVVEGIGGRENRVQIWDRWGREVLNTVNYQNNFSAKGMSDGVYFYYIKVLEQEYTGHVQVLNGR